MFKRHCSVICISLLISVSANATQKSEWASRRVMAGLSWISFVLSAAPSFLPSASPTGSLGSNYSQILRDLYPSGTGVFGNGTARGDEPRLLLSQKPKEFHDFGSSVFLPQFDPDSQNRSAALMAIQAEIQNYPRSYAYDGIHEELISRGPIPIPGSLAAQMVQQEIADILSRATPNAAAIIVTETSGLPTKTLEDLENLYSHLTSFPVPNGLKHWEDDRYFADLRRTYLGHNLRKLPLGKPLFEVCLNPEQEKELLGEGRTFKNSELYASDLSEVGAYTATDGRPQYAPSAQVLYGMNSKKEFVVLAIRLGNGFVYSQFDSQGEWLLAKIAATTAEFLWTSAVHFSRTHLLVEPLRTETMRHLSVRHPLYVLLNLHMKNLFGNTVAGLLDLFSLGTTLDRLSGWGAEGYMKFLGDHPQDFKNFTRTLHEDIAERGLEQLPQFRQLEDKKALLGHVQSFVRSYLNQFYGDKLSGAPNVRDRNVRNDYELQAWAEACHSPDGAGVSSFPSEFKSFDDLEKAVVQIIYLLAIEHHAMNSNALWHGYPLPASPMALWAPLPTHKGEVVNPREYIFPAEATIQGQIVLFDFFLRPLKEGDSLRGSYNTLKNQAKFAPHQLNELLASYDRSMQELQNHIEEREKNLKNRAAYPILAPQEVPDFVWVR